MEMKTPIRHHRTPVRMAIVNQTTIVSVGEVVEKEEPPFTAGGNVNWYSHYGKHIVVPQKINNRVTIRPSNLSSGYLPPKFKTSICKDIRIPMFTAALFLVP